MSRFNELNTNLNNVMLQLITSQNLCKLLHYTNDSPLTQPDISDTSTLLFDRIYPLPKVPDPQVEQGTMITVLFDDIKPNNNLGFKDSLLIFNVICHIEQWRLQGQIRPYAIAAEIDKLFNQQRVLGIGKTLFARSRFIYMNDKFSGYALEYRITDFN